MSDLIKDLKYVIVEMIENSKEKAVSKSIKSGLLKGVKAHRRPGQDEKESDVLIVLEDKGNVLYLLNLSFYNILSIKKSDGATKVATYFRANEDDQAKAFEMIAEVMTGMHAAERTDKNDSTLINLETYTNLPDDFSSTKADDNTTTTISKSSTYTPTVSRSSNVNRSIIKPVKVDNEIKPFFFKRGSKKPTEEALKEMEKRIKDITSGKLKIKLPVIAGDDQEAVVAADDDDYEASYMYCMG